MSAIIPAILPTSRNDLAEKLLRLQGIADEVQIDIIDGSFVPHTSWPYTEPQGIAALASVSDDQIMPYGGSLRFETDIMVRDAETTIGLWIRAGATRITVHAETTTQLPQLVRDINVKYGHDKNFAPDLLSFGLAIGFDTEIALIEPYLSECDYVQFMGIQEIGMQGQPFDARVLSKIAEFRAKYPDMTIQVDGGVSLRTAPALLEAGVSRLVVGSAFWQNPDLAGTMQQFNELLSQYGLYSS